MSFRWSMDVRNARLDAVRAQIDRAATPGRLEVYATAQPAGGADPGGAPLTTIVLQKPCGTVANGVLRFANSYPAQINPGGTAAWGRLKDGDGFWLGDGDIALTGTADAAFTLDNLVLLAGAFVFLFEAALTEPA